MKKNSLLFVVGFLALALNGFSQIKVNSAGKVGINNTNPSYRLDVSGNLRLDDGSYTILFNYGEFYPSSGSLSLGNYSSRWYDIYGVYAYLNYSPIITSDLNMKTEVRDLVNVKNKFHLLRPVIYKLKGNKSEAESSNKKIDDQYGLIAQEVKELFPEIVTENEDGSLGIRYTELIPVVINMIQSQQKEIDVLKEQIFDLQKNSK